MSISQKGLVLHLKLDSIDGTTLVKDSSAYRNHGTLIGAAHLPTLVTGKVGNGIQFDGTEDRISITNNSSINPTRISVCAWVNISTADRFNIVISKRTDDNNRYELYINSSNLFRFIAANGAANVLASSTSLTATINTWYHLVGTYDGTTVSIYINGSLQPTTGALSGNSASGSDDLLIGRQGPSTSNFFAGKIDDVRIYNRALTATEIQQLYIAGVNSSDSKFALGSGTGSKLVVTG